MFETIEELSFHVLDLLEELGTSKEGVRADFATLSAILLEKGIILKSTQLKILESAIEYLRGLDFIRSRRTMSRPKDIYIVKKGKIALEKLKQEGKNSIKCSEHI
jgi:hypothetical protein